jgi:hypothetical protein
MNSGATFDRIFRPTSAAVQWRAIIAAVVVVVTVIAFQT